MRRRTNSSGTYVFLGPSLPVGEAVGLLDAVFLPPVAVGDVYRLVREVRPARIAIIDGYFERMAAVWHKELLFAMEQGIEVSGAASMGALRAAELDAFGMIGVGRIYREFRAGRLTADDEVAVVHGPAERGYPVVSTALVDLRAGLDGAVRRRQLPARARDRLIAGAAAQFYRDRSGDAVVAMGRDARLPRRQLAVLEALASSAPSQKAADARALLRRLARNRSSARPARGRGRGWRMERTWFWQRFVEIYEPE